MTRSPTMLAMCSVVVAGCSVVGSAPADRLITPEHAVLSPSGEYTGSVDLGAEDNGVTTWIPVVGDSSGREVFRDDHDGYSPCSTRQKLVVTWLSNKPAELWVYSGDVGTFMIAPQADGGWAKQSSPAPPEIADLVRTGRVD